MHDEEKKDIYIVETKAFAESKISKPSLTFIRWLSGLILNLHGSSVLPI